MADSSPIDAYLATLPANQREALERLRARVHRLVPGLTETMSYGMPALRHEGGVLLWFAGWKHHCAIYPLTEAFLADKVDELAGFGRTKGSLHFTPEMPLPDALLDAFVRARLDDVEGTTT
ncbi:MAG TPA: DUF1801 domain-containing protein [Candidatus Limnocylindria bacterium]